MATQFKVSRDLRGELSFSFLNYTLKAGQLLSLADDVASSYEVQIALSRKMISPVVKSEVAEKKEEDPAPVVKTPKSNVRKTLKEEIPDEVVTERKTTMLAYDMENKEVIQKGKSQKMALERMNIEDQTEVLTGDIDFDEAEKKTSAKKEKKSSTKKDKKGGIKPVGNKREEVSANDGEDILIDETKFDDIGFVDEEQATERMNRHPILKDNNNEVM